MKVSKGINPNCSEIIVRLGVEWNEEDLKEELKALLQTSDKLEIGLIKYNFDADYKLPDWERHTIVRLPELGIDDFVIDGDSFVAKEVPGNALSSLKVESLEKPGLFDVSLFLKGILTSGASISQHDNGEACLMIGDYDTSKFSIIAEAMHAGGYYWHPFDGGHGDAFEQWCNKNQYPDIADRNLYR